MTMERIGLDHGSGGEASHELVKEIFLSRLDNVYLRPLDDSAVLDLPACTLAMTTDSYVVDPIFFPGGDIGSLAVHGTVNDLSMQGARPLYLTLGLILEQGLFMEDLVKIIDSMAEAAQQAGVSVVAPTPGELALRSKSCSVGLSAAGGNERRFIATRLTHDSIMPSTGGGR